MPNHVTNIIETGNPEVLKALNGENGLVDFNALIPFPEELKSIPADGLKVFDTQEEADKYNAEKWDEYSRIPVFATMFDENTRFALVRAEFDALSEKHHGAINWYSWNSLNWGTKWNAYEIQETTGYTVTDGVSIAFDTAWAHPRPIIRALSEKFPDEELTVSYADEDLGSNFGSYVIKGGEILRHLIEEDSRTPYEEQRDIAHQIKYGFPYEPDEDDEDEEEED